MHTFESDTSEKIRKWLFKWATEFRRVFILYAVYWSQHRPHNLAQGSADLYFIMDMSTWVFEGLWADSSSSTSRAVQGTWTLALVCHMKPIQFPIRHISFSHWDIIETNLHHLNIQHRVLLLSRFIHFIRCQRSAEPTCIYIHREPRCSELSARKTGQLIIPKSSRRARRGSDSKHNQSARAGGTRTGRKALHPDPAPVCPLPFPSRYWVRITPLTASL